MPGGSGGIDYSKWDHLDEYSDSDAEEGDKNEPKSAPRVTRLDQPSSVTFGGPGGEVNTTTPSVGGTNAAAVSALTPSAGGTTTDSNGDSKAAAISTDTKGKVDNWTVKGGFVITTTTTNKDNRQLYWTQDRYSVTIRYQLLEDEKPVSVTVDGILPYGDRHCAMGTTKPRLQVAAVDGGTNNNDNQDCKNKILLLDGNLPHPVHLANDDDGIDWCIERREIDGNDYRFITITLYKAVPMQGLFIWWKRPLMEYEEIDIDQEPSQASKEFLHAWEEAHKLFKEKKKREPYPI